MISMARAFGAPVIDAGGNRARMMPATGAWVRPVTVEVICHTVGWRSTAKREGTRTLPASAMRPMSLRTMSTIITFSARFFSHACRRAAASSSAWNESSRDAVPFMGTDVTSPSSSVKNNSGESEMMAKRPVSTNAP
jgi:hypothetical protein